MKMFYIWLNPGELVMYPRNDSSNLSSSRIFFCQRKQNRRFAGVNHKIFSNFFFIYISNASKLNHYRATPNLFGHVMTSSDILQNIFKPYLFSNQLGLGHWDFENWSVRKSTSFPPSDAIFSKNEMKS